MILICYLLHLFIILLVGVYVVLLSFASYLNDFQQLDRKIWHGSLMLIGTTLTGVGVMIFRLLPDLRTRVIKYVHLLLQTLSVIFMLMGYLCVDNAAKDFEEFKNRSTVQELPATKLHLYSNVHMAIGRMTVMAFALEYILGWFLYTCFPIRTRARILSAPIHDVFGIWIFLCLISAIITGVYMVYDMSLGYRMIINVKYRPVSHMNFMFVLLFGAGVIVLIILICPYFDWELVGNI